MGNLLGMIITNKNHASLLPRQLNSIVNQTVKPDQLVVIDDGSTEDNSQQIITDFYNNNKNTINIKIFLYNENKGVGYRISEGVNQMDTKYIYMAASNDYLLQNFFKYHKNTIKEYAPAIVSSDVNLPTTGFTEGSELPSMKYYIPGHCSSIKKELLISVGTHKEEFKWHGDWFAFHAVAMKYGWYTIKKNLSVKTCDSKNSYSNIGINSDEQPIVIKAMLDEVKTNSFFYGIREQMTDYIHRRVHRGSEVK